MNDQNTAPVPNHYADNVLIEVRCCCDPENFVGFLPASVGRELGLKLLLQEDGGVAFDAHGRKEEIEAHEAFFDAKKKGTKTWRKLDGESVQGYAGPGLKKLAGDVDEFTSVAARDPSRAGLSDLGSGCNG